MEQQQTTFQRFPQPGWKCPQVFRRLPQRFCEYSPAFWRSPQLFQRLPQFFRGWHWCNLGCFKHNLGQPILCLGMPNWNIGMSKSNLGKHESYPGHSMYNLSKHKLASAKDLFAPYQFFVYLCNIIWYNVYHFSLASLILTFLGNFKTILRYAFLIPIKWII